MKFKKLFEQSIKDTKQKIRDSVTKDQLIAATVAEVEDLDKVCNILVKRLRDLYSFYNPEFSKAMSDNEKFSELVIKKSKKELLKELKVKDSMGADLEKVDVDSIILFAKQINNLYSFRAKQVGYLESKMKKLCPNLQAVAGTMLGAKLIHKTGSFKRLMFMSASTIQVLGAEKALFRHMITGAKPPRHGLIINHPLISGAKQSEHGKRARGLADKISIAVKIDYFKGEFIGDKLRKELDEKFK